MEIRTDNIVFSITGEYLPHLVIGFFLLGAAGFCRTTWVRGWENWIGIFNHIEPSLKSTPSPFDQTAIGCSGLFAAFFCAILTVVFTVLGLEQLVFSGIYWNRLVEWVWQRLSQG